MRRVSTAVLIAVAGVAAVGLGPGRGGSGAAGAATLSAQVVDSDTVVRPSVPVTGTSSATITAAQNEFESFQLVLSGGASALTVDDVTATSLTGPGPEIPAGNVTIYRAMPYHVTTASDLEGGTGDWFDALVPRVDPIYNQSRNAFPMTISANQNGLVWVDVLVPQHQLAGTYHGTVNVVSSGVTTPVDVSLNVLGFSIPSTSSLPSLFNIGYYGAPCKAFTDNGDALCNGNTDERYALASMIGREALENRVTIANPWPLGPDQAPPTGSPTPGSDRDLWNRYVLPLIGGSSPQDTAGLWSPVRLPGAQMTSVDILWPCVSSCISSWKTEATTNGFFDRLEYYACDEIPTPSSTCPDWATFKNNVNAANATQPALNVLLTNTINDTNANNATSLVNTITPVIQRLDDKNGTYAGNQRAQYNSFVPPGRLWSYTACFSFGCDAASKTDHYFDGWPGYAIDEPASQSRAMSWLAYRFNFTGELYYDVTQSLSTAWTNQMASAVNGDGNLFYPGLTHADNPVTCPTAVVTLAPPCIGGTHDIPIESIRLKRIRDGREDYEYLKYLTDHGLGTQAANIAAGLFPDAYSVTAAKDGPAGVPGTVEAARSQLIALIQSTTPKPEIAFTRSSGGTSSIWVMDRSGNNQTQVSHPPAGVSDSQPSWSPDGTKIAFTRGSGSSAEIYTVTLAGGAEQRLTNNNVMDEKPAFSHDGTAIAFVTHAANGNGQISVMAANGTNVIDLSRNTANNDYDPAWSHSDSQISFSSVRTTNVGAGSDIYSMNANGTGAATNLTQNAGDDDLPSYEPTDVVIAFDSLRNANQYDLFWMSPDGTGPQNLTNTTTTNEYDPTWSSDDLLAFTRGATSGGSTAIWSMTTQGPPTAPVDLSNPAAGANDSQADWLTSQPGPADRPPVANAGPDQSPGGSTTTLDGTASSDPDGDTLAYRWTQLSGPAATIASSSAATTSVTGITGTAPLVFQLTVIDPRGLSATDTVTVTPTGSAGATAPVLGMVDTSGNAFVKVGSLTGAWTKVTSGATALAVATDPTNGPLIAINTSTGVYAKQGSVTGPWTHESAANVGATAIAVASDATHGPLIAINTPTGVYAKQGLTAPWTHVTAANIGVNAISVASDATHGPLLAINTPTGTYAKLGSLTAAWTHETAANIGVNAIAVATDPTNGPLIAINTPTGTYAKQGTLTAAWTHETAANIGANAIAVATDATHGALVSINTPTGVYAKQGLLTSPWTHETATNVGVTDISVGSDATNGPLIGINTPTGIYAKQGTLTTAWTHETAAAAQTISNAG